MNRTTTVAVALIVAGGPSTMVYALPEQRAIAHLLASEGLMYVHVGTYPQQCVQIAYNGDLNNNVEANMHGNGS
jgi:hypothetical protein